MRDWTLPIATASAVVILFILFLVPWATSILPSETWSFDIYGWDEMDDAGDRRHDWRDPDTFTREDGTTAPGAGPLQAVPWVLGLGLIGAIASLGLMVWRDAPYVRSVLLLSALALALAGILFHAGLDQYLMDLDGPIPHEESVGGMLVWVPAALLLVASMRPVDGGTVTQ